MAIHGRTHRRALPSRFTKRHLAKLQYQRTRHKEGVFQIIGPTKRSIEKGVADGIVAAIRSRERNGSVELPKPPRLKRGDVVRILKGPFAHHVGLYHG
jgi:hypothetical protein